jgi:hypothetical protein
MNEIIFLIEEAPESGYYAKALSPSIFTEANTINELHHKLRDAVQCHFDEGIHPTFIMLIALFFD